MPLYLDKIETDRMFATRSEIVAQHGMAATSHPLAFPITVK